MPKKIPPMPDILNITDLDELARLRIEDQIASTRRDKEEELKRKQRNHRDLYNKVLAAKDSAEKNFPTTMKEVEGQIKDAVKMGYVECKYRMKADSEEAINLMIMLVSTLQLQEFNCTYYKEEYSKDGFIHIRW